MRPHCVERPPSTPAASWPPRSGGSLSWTTSWSVTMVPCRRCKTSTSVTRRFVARSARRPANGEACWSRSRPLRPSPQTHQGRPAGGRLRRPSSAQQGETIRHERMGMLRRAENVTISHQPNWLTGMGWEVVTIGGRTYRARQKCHKDQFAQTLKQQQEYPTLVMKVGERTYWMFQDKFYWENENLTDSQVYALIVTRQQRRARQIETAEQIVAIGSEPRSTQRTGIPDDVKHLVWIRDNGRCRRCGSTNELQFDHIIPVALGGGSSAENVQVLCGPCNRLKGAGLTGD
jgi:HNH endonuclease